jgi:hypothetical protein
MSTPLRSMLAALAIGAGVLAALAGSPAPPPSPDEIGAVELAGWLRDRRPGLLVLDVRSAQAMQRDRLPGARQAAEVAGGAVDTLVLYGDRQLEHVPAVRVSARRVLRLHGGIEAWNEEVLFPAIRSDAPEREQQAFAGRAQLSRYFGGAPRVLDPGMQAARGTRSRRGC